MNTHDFRTDPPLTPRKAIRQKCLDCCAGSAYEVKHCGIVDCTLWPLRMGRGICTDMAGKIIKTRDPTEAQIEKGRSLAKMRHMAS